MYARKGLALLRACLSGERLHSWPTEALNAEGHMRSTIAAALVLFVHAVYAIWRHSFVSGTLHACRVCCFQMMCTPEPVDSVFAKEELVYLSADATDVVTELDPTKVMLVIDVRAVSNKDLLCTL
jgi:hypothetical protein